MTCAFCGHLKKDHERFSCNGCRRSTVAAHSHTPCSGFLERDEEPEESYDAEEKRDRDIFERDRARERAR